MGGFTMKILILAVTLMLMANSQAAFAACNLHLKVEGENKLQVSLQFQEGHPSQKLDMRFKPAGASCPISCQLEYGDSACLEYWILASNIFGPTKDTKAAIEACLPAMPPLTDKIIWPIFEETKKAGGELDKSIACADPDEIRKLELKTKSPEN
ncbi:hypothetical protein BH10PSE19_BH10PSE19_01020 [soil metagenome]